MDSSSCKGSRAANFYSRHDVRRDQVLCTFIILLAAPTMGEPITCDFPSVAPMEEARLTCNFPEDVSGLQKDIMVYRHVLHGSPEAVLGCWWRNAHRNCSTRQGYVFDGVVSNHLTIRVPHATADKTGTYACHVTGYRADEAKICEFILKNDVPDHSSYKGLTIQHNYPILHVVDGMIIGLLVFLLLLIALAMCYLRHRIRIREVWGRLTKVFKDKELDPLVKHEQGDGGSKHEPEVPEVVEVCGRRRNALCGLEGPALSRPESIVETIETEQDETDSLPPKYESCANHIEPRIEKKSRDTPRQEEETNENDSQSEYHLEAGETCVGRSVPLTEESETCDDQFDSGLDENGSYISLEKSESYIDTKQNESCEDQTDSVGDTTQGAEEQPASRQEEHEEQRESLQERREVSKDSSLQEDCRMNKDQAEPLREENEISQNQTESLQEGDGINNGQSDSPQEGHEINKGRSDSLQEELETDEDQSEETDEDSDDCLLDKNDTDEDQCDYQQEQSEADDAGDIRVCPQAVAMDSNHVCLGDTYVTPANSVS